MRRLAALLQMHRLAALLLPRRLPALLLPRRLAALLLIGHLTLLAAEWPRLSEAPANAYGSVDHQSQVYIAAEAYDTAAKLAVAFPKLEVREAGYLPVRFILTNHSGQTADIRQMRINLMTRDRVRLSPVEDREAEQQILYHDFARRQHGVRLPGPRRAPSPETARQFELRLFKTRMIPPQATETGFIFFHLPADAQNLEGATIYISDVYLGDTHTPLFYFEIHLR